MSFEEDLLAGLYNTTSTSNATPRKITTEAELNALLKAAAALGIKAPRIPTEIRVHPDIMQSVINQLRLLSQIHNQHKMPSMSDLKGYASCLLGLRIVEKETLLVGVAEVYDQHGKIIKAFTIMRTPGKVVG